MDRFFGSAYRGDSGVPHSGSDVFETIWIGSTVWSAISWFYPYYWQICPEYNCLDIAILTERYKAMRAAEKGKDYEFQASQSMCNWMQRNDACDDFGHDNPANLDSNPRIQWLMGTTTEQGFQNFKKRSIESTGFSPSRCINMNTCFWRNDFSSPSGQFTNIMYRQEPVSDLDVPFLQCPSNFVMNMERHMQTDFSLSHLSKSPILGVTRTQARKFDTLNLLGVHHEFNDETRDVTIGSSSSLGNSIDNHHTSMIDFFKKADTNPPNHIPIDTRGSCFSSTDTGFISNGPPFLKGDRNPEDIVSNPVNCGFRKVVPFCYPTFGKGSSPTTSTEPSLTPPAAPPTVVKAQKGSTKRGTTTTAKGKELKKSSRKAVGGGSFPANVKSLLSTGIFDGLCVKYVSWDRKKSVKAVIKGPGYLCGCQDCNFSKIVNAYEMESHAGCKTKHPNGHIYFGNGKTVYEVVQELKTKSEDQLLQAIRNVTGFGVNDANFDIWKASFQSANEELKRICGGDGSSCSY